MNPGDWIQISIYVHSVFLMFILGMYFAADKSNSVKVQDFGLAFVKATKWPCIIALFLHIPLVALVDMLTTEPLYL